MMTVRFDPLWIAAILVWFALFPWMVSTNPRIYLQWRFWLLALPAGALFGWLMLAFAFIGGSSLGATIAFSAIIGPELLDQAFRMRRGITRFRETPSLSREHAEILLQRAFFGALIQQTGLAAVVYLTWHVVTGGDVHARGSYTVMALGFACIPRMFRSFAARWYPARPRLDWRRPALWLLVVLIAIVSAIAGGVAWAVPTPRESVLGVPVEDLLVTYGLYEMYSCAVWMLQDRASRARAPGRSGGAHDAPSRGARALAEVPGAEAGDDVG